MFHHSVLILVCFMCVTMTGLSYLLQHYLKFKVEMVNTFEKSQDYLQEEDLEWLDVRPSFIDKHWKVCTLCLDTVATDLSIHGNCFPAHITAGCSRPQPEVHKDQWNSVSPLYSISQFSESFSVMERERQFSTRKCCMLRGNSWNAEMRKGIG